MSRFFVAVLFVVTTLLISGCSTTYNSYARNSDGTAEVILASENEIVSASYEAIIKTFPSANVLKLAPPALGFSWYVMPLLDKTDFRFMLSRRVGDAPNKGKVSGWGYNIGTYGTQGLVEARYVTPLVNELQTILKERNISTAMLSNVSYVGVSDGKSAPEQGQIRNTGTGFFVSNDGYLITNQHVVVGASEIEVLVHNGRRYPASVVSSDASNDVALLRIDADTIPLTIAPATNVKKGAEVFTLGYPFVGIQGQEQKATFGRINAFSGIQGDIRYFQIDVPIQPGNSGGPLITDDGYVVGVVTASLNQLNVLKATGTLPQNVNYAVKSEYFQPLLHFSKIEIPQSLPAVAALRDPARYERSVVFIEAK